MTRNAKFALKHIADTILAVCLLVVFSPLLLILAACIFIDDGFPIFFRQSRLGKDGETFEIIKFRTMVRDADAMLDRSGRPIGTRITRVGRILRFLSLDELPQLLNIARGEMSFVGPRPALVEHLARYDESQKLRLSVRPGITGLAQVNGRNEIKWSERISYDVEYVEAFSFWLDFKILLKTFRVWLLREGIVVDRNPEQVDDLKPLEAGHHAEKTQEADNCEKIKS